MVSQWSNAYRGKYKEPLDGADFYKAVGRPDLASDYRTASTLKWIGYGLGLAAEAGSGLLLVSGKDCWEQYPDDIYGESPGYKECEKDQTTKFFFGLGAMGAGLFLGLAAAFYDPNPVSQSEARRLAAKHNKKLRDKLGLSEDQVAETSPLSYSLGISGTRDGGGLRLRVDF